MSNVVDQRVVEMQFDNSRFEKNVSTTMSTLEKLKQSLNLTGAAKGLESVGTAAKGINLSGLGSAAETVTAKFSYMQMTIQHQLNQLVDSAIATGKRMAAALTIDPIKTGFSEYETQINAVQTILANTQSKGTTITDVNAALDELNTYADKTIYNFTQMTRNIGTFTAAGVDLDKSVTSIKGIANLAAVSGSTSQQASTAMYQLSQALASGTVKLMDWNSVVNAGMGGQVFQDALKRTATHLGYNVDAMIEKYGSFRESLTQGNWLTAEVLTETLSQLAGAYSEADLISQGYTKQQAKEIVELAATAESAATDVKTFTQLWDTLKESAQSGWTQTWELIIGDFEEAKATLSKVSKVIGDIINDSSEARNKLLSDTLDTNWEKLTKKINEAGIETATFEEKVKAVMKDHGIDVDAVIKKHGSLEEAFRSGAVSSDILKEAVDKLGTSLVDLSGVEAGLKKGSSGEQVKKVQTALKELGHDLGSFGADGVFGQKTEEAVKKFQELNNLEVTGIIDEETLEALDKANTKASKLGDSCKELIDNITELGGREILIEGLKNIFEGLMNVIKPIKEAFTEIFPPITAEKLLGFIKGFRDLTEKLTFLEEKTVPVKKGFQQITAAVDPAAEHNQKLSSIIDKVARTFKGLFAAVDIVVTIVGALVGGIVDLVGIVAPAGEGLLSMTAALGDWLVELRDSVKETDFFGETIDKVVGFIKKFVDGVKEFYGSIKEKFVPPDLSVFGAILDWITERMSAVGKAAGSVKDALVNAFGKIGTFLENSNIFEFFRLLWDGVKTLVSGIASGLGAFIDVIGEKITNGDFKGFLDIINTLIAGGIGLKIKDLFGNAADGVEDFGKIFKSLADKKKGIPKMLDDIRGCFEAYQTQLKAGTLKQIATAIAIIAAAVILLSFVDSEKLNTAVGAITMMFVDLIGAMAVFDKASINDKGLVKLSGVMIGMSVAVLIMAVALRSLAGLEFEQLFTGVVGIIMVTSAIVYATKQLDNGGKAVMKGAFQLILFAAAIKILASAVIDMAQLSFEQLINGLAGVGGLIAGLYLFVNNTKSSGKFMSMAFGLIALSIGIKILASAVIDMSSIPFEQLINGLGGVIGILGGLSLFINNTNSKNLISTGVGIIAMAAGIKILASCVTDLASLSINEMLTGLIALGVSLVMISEAAWAMPKDLLSIGVGLIAVGAGVAIIAQAIKSMGSMSFGEMIVGLVALGGAIVILAFGLTEMTGTLPGAAALLVASVALMALVPAMTALGAMSWESVIKGLVALAGILTVIGVAGYVLAPAAGAIATLAGSIALISLSILGIGAGLYLVAAAFTALAVAGTAGATAIVSALTVIITGVLALIPAIIESLAEVIVSICGVITSCAPAIGEAIKAVVLSTIDVLVQCIPPLVDGILLLVAELLTSLAEYTPQIVSGLFEFLIGLLDGLAAYLPQLIQSAMNVIGAFFQGIVDALSGIDSTSLLEGIVGVGLLAGLMFALSSVAALVPGAMVGVLGMGVVIAELALVLAAIGALAQIPGLEWLISEGGDFLQAIGTAIGQFVGGIVGGIAEGATSTLPQLGTNLSDFMTNVTPFIEGAKSLDASMLEGVRALADTILVLTAADILSGITSWITGGSSLSDFATQLVPFGQAMKDYSLAIAGMDAAAVTASVVAAQALVELANNLPNTGGLVSWFTGDNNMGDFATKLVPFGKAMKEYSDAIAGMNPEAVTASATAGKALVELANALPNDGGIVSWFTGDNNMGDFATNLVPFGKGLKGYSDAVVGVDSAAVSASVTAAKSLVGLADAIPNSGGLASLFSGDNDLGTFASGLVPFGLSLSAYSVAVLGVNPAAVANSVSAAKQLISLVNGITTVDIGAIQSFKTAIGELGTVNVAAIVDAFKGGADKLSGVGADMISAIIEGFQARKDNLTRVVISTIVAMLEAISSKKATFKVAGIEIISEFINGIAKHTSRAERVFKSMMTNIASVLSDYKKLFYNAGAYLVDGFANGITANRYKAAARARAMAKAAADAAKAELDEHSPSKVGYEIGDFFGVAFVNAIGEYVDKAYDTSSAVADSAKNGLANAISRVKDFVESGIDSQPTIRPVLDLSDVQAGVGAIGGMLNMGSSIGVMANVGAISSMMSSRNQNGANAEVVSAINRLSKQLDSVGNTTYQVNGVTYDDGSNISDAVKTLVRAARIERRV